VAEDHCHGLSLEQEIAVAREALSVGDLRHCAHHVSNALVDAPESLEVDELVRRLFSAARDPLTLVEAKGQVYVGTVVLRSRFLERLGRHGEALELLFRAQEAAPEAPLLVGLERFLEHPELFRDADIEALSAVMYAPAADEPARFLPFLEGLRRPDQLSLRLEMSIARCLRGVGRVDEAVETSRKIVEQAPGFLTFVSLGSSLKDADRDDEAAEAWSRALTYDPENIYVRMDIGDLELNRERYAEAARLYAEALEREPQNDWALPSWLYACWKESGDEAARARLVELAAKSSPGSRALQLADDAAPYRFSLNPPRSSVMQSGRHALELRDGLVSVASSSIEAPSAVFALFDSARELSPEGDLPGVSFSGIPTPDPRVPLAPVTRALWRYPSGGLLARIAGKPGESAEPGVPPPVPEITSRVERVIATPYDLERWTKSAAALAVELSESDIDQLLAVMVHPPPPPKSADPWEFRFAVQVAAALVISYVGDGWEGSARRSALSDLLLGPVDWTTSAAIIAACNLARTEPALNDEICALLSPLLAVDGGPIHFANITEPLLRCLPWIPKASTELSRWARRAE
jgi:tetratricopeptide (TPR) repeat protein